MPRNIIHLLVLPLLVAACDAPVQTSTPPATEPLRVRASIIESSVASPLETYSGIVRARRETRITSEVPARILQRHVTAGQAVRQGQTLFTLDADDLDRSLDVARAELNAAQAERDVSEADLQRWEQLATRQAASAQSLDQARRAHRASVARVEAATAQVKLAQTRQHRSVIRAPFDGVILEVHAEEGQIAQLQEPLAMLAAEGEREVEVYLPDAVAAPREAVIHVAGISPLRGTLVESGGALDAFSKTRRTRYRVPEVLPLALGSVVSVQLALPVSIPHLRRVPAGAIDERGGGPQVWTMVAGKATPVPVQLVSLWGDSAVISADLAPGTRVITLGTHLLSEGMAVQELAP